MKVIGFANFRVPVVLIVAGIVIAVAAVIIMLVGYIKGYKNPAGKRLVEAGVAEKTARVGGDVV
jgi:multisubunit Na+/H+ antiporter MnhC subunit